MHAVYAYGVIAPSTLIELADEYPDRGAYGEIAAVHPSLGGEAAAGAYVLGRLGVPTKLAGNVLGTGADADRAIEMFESAGVDCSAIERVDDMSVTEIVIADGPSRTVFGTYGRLHRDRAWSAPSESDVERSRIVCLDPFFDGASDQVARWCTESATPYVTVDCRPESAIARHADALVVSQDYATRELGDGDPAAIHAEYTATCDGLVILTWGAEPLWYGRRGAPPSTFTPFRVDARDTTGAGDSFRAGIVDGLLRGLDDDTLVRSASGIAALVCRGIGVLDSPTRGELTAFLATAR